MYTYPLKIVRAVALLKNQSWSIVDSRDILVGKVVAPFKAATRSLDVFSDAGATLPAGQIEWTSPGECTLRDESGKPEGSVRAIGDVSNFRLPDFEGRDAAGGSVIQVVIGRRWMYVVNMLLSMVVGGILPALLRSKYFRPTVTVVVGGRSVLRVAYSASLFAYRLSTT